MDRLIGLFYPIVDVISGITMIIIFIFSRIFIKGTYTGIKMSDSVQLDLAIDV